jgi:hypothetical protein
VKVLSLREGISVNNRKLGGVCKISKAGWVDLVDSGLTRSRSIGSRSNSCGGLRVKR